MDEKNKANSFKKLLDRLQEDSWQLELLISGFAIFGLFYALNPVINLEYKAQFNDNYISASLYSIIIFSIYILIFNLLLHVILRGLWIGSLGLRYVSGEIEFNNLNYSEKFTKYLKKKVGSFDNYIDKLENICSVIFAISFLLIFYVIAFFSLGFTIYFIVIFFQVVHYDWIRLSIGIPLVLFFSVGALLTFIDFITQGYLKKKKWISKIYFPFFWVFSILTLSFLYRPLVCNFLDNKFGRRISLLLIPVYIIISSISTIEFKKSNFITIDSTAKSNSIVANGSNYEDMFENDDHLFIEEFAIQSKVITEPYIKILVPISKKLEDNLIQLSPNLKIEEDKRGFQLAFLAGWNSVSERSNYDSLGKIYLRSFEKLYNFKVDTITFNPDFVLTDYGDDVLGFESYIGIKELSEGKHIINFQRIKNIESDSLISIRKVPFWYYNND